MLNLRIVVATTLAALGLLTSGCSSGCHSSAYDIDLSQPGSSSPSNAIHTWRTQHLVGMPTPPARGWVKSASFKDGSVRFKNSEHSGWNAEISSTRSGGWVVSGAEWGTCDSSS